MDNTAFGCIANTILLKSGLYLDLKSPSVEVIDVRDIAAGLAKTCRFGGQIERFYSVAQHLVNCHSVAKEWGYSIEEQRAVLFHDATEAYIQDIVKPLKIMLSGYQEVEERLLSVIGERFGIDFESHTAAIKAVDNAMLIHERDQLFMRRNDSEWPGESEVLRINLRINPWAWSRAEEIFIERAQQLGCR